LPRRRLDGAEVLGLALVARTKATPDGLRLDRDDADRMGDDVVELPRDPRPLFGDGGASLLLAFPVERIRELLERRGAQATPAERPTGNPRAGDQEAYERILLGAAAVLARCLDPSRGEAGDASQQSAAERAVGGDRVDRHEEGDELRQRGVSRVREKRLGGEGPGGDAHREQRCAPP
jgi:hypothetical protein